MDADTPALGDVEAASKAIKDWVQANPADFEPVDPAHGFERSPERITVSYLHADRAEVSLRPPLWVCVATDTGTEVVMVTDMKAFLRSRWDALDVTGEFESPDSPAQDTAEPSPTGTNTDAGRAE